MVNDTLTPILAMKIASFRDPQIRRPLHRWLAKKFSDHEDTEILHELKVLRPSGRVDLAVVNGRLAAFEIKSDYDSLSRLPRQVRAFSAVFDEVCVVTTERHRKAAKTIIPVWWRLTIRTAREGKTKFRTVQRGFSNPSVRPDALLHMLTRSELLSITQRRALVLNRRSKRIEIINSLLDCMKLEDIQSEVRGFLKLRAKATTRHRHRIR